ncbi:hypothetical protein HELRODRAFT_194412 [Helobdella robusta]|uniref:UspA domain-containing protein n=1 Tax=Helobdella robusta TaxID=6412 RepID=T1FW11_HELRO|nr:hypothetical protein HELRODRAFT_194412 [Helobdella robusta]ESN92022.1 hypothetical protein HELRODRAFT_194412 [Helobdella robusta]
MSSPPKERTSSTSEGGVTWDPVLLDKSDEAIAQRRASRRRSSIYGTFNRVVVVAVDTSDHARKAFEWFVMNVWKSDDFVVLIHCPEAPKLPTFSFKSGIAPPIDEWWKILGEMNQNTKKLEEDYQTVCTLRKMKHKVRAEAMKNVGEGILKIASEENADLVVCGCKGAGESSSKSVKRGMVAEYISRYSSIPVLLVPSRVGE